MCGALSHLPVDKVDDGWLYTMEETPQNPKLTNFLDYFADQWLDNSRVPKELWNVHGQRHRTNNVVQGWNSNSNKVIGKKTLSIYL